MASNEKIVMHEQPAAAVRRSSVSSATWSEAAAASPQPLAPKRKVAQAQSQQLSKKSRTAAKATPARQKRPAAVGGLPQADSESDVDSGASTQSVGGHLAATVMMTLPDETGQGERLLHAHATGRKYYLSAIAKSDVGGQYEAEASIPPNTTSVTDPKSVNYKITNSKSPTTQLAALRRRLVFLMPQPDADQKQGIIFAQRFEHKPGKVPVALWDALYEKLKPEFPDLSISVLVHHAMVRMSYLKKLKQPAASFPSFSQAGGMGVGMGVGSMAAAAPAAAADSMLSSFPQVFTPASGGGSIPYAQLPSPLMQSAMTGQPMLDPTMLELAQHPLTEVFARMQSFSFVQTMHCHSKVREALQQFNALAQSVS